MAMAHESTPEKRPASDVPQVSGFKKLRTQKLQFKDRFGKRVPESKASLLAELHDIIHGAPAPFACGGQLQIPEAPIIRLKSGESFAIKPPNLRSTSEPDPLMFWMGVSKQEVQQYVNEQTDAFRGLCEKMLPASFGHGQETKIDPGIRDALQLAAKDFDVNIPESALAVVLTEIQSQLKIHSELQAEMYALNVYQKDGHFARHKDTPRGEDMIGSLVVCLPAFFEGGELVVEQGLDRKVFFRNRKSFAPENCRKPVQNEEMTNLEWCAFFADVDHMVKKVSAGMRMTVSYLLRRKDGKDASAQIPRCLSEEAQHQMMVEAFQGAKNSLLAEGKSIGFPCFFLYTNTDVFPKKAHADTPLPEKIIQKLKGRDAVVAKSALTAGLKVRLIPYLTHDYSGDFDCGPAEIPLNRFPGKKRVPRRMSDDSIEMHFDTSLDEDSRLEGQPDVWVMKMERAASGCAGSTEWNADGYFGNEASGITFYVKAGLHVSID